VSQLAPQIPDPGSASPRQLASALSDMVRHPEYPCLGARSVFHRDRATVRVYDELAGEGVAARLLADLRAFAADTDPDAGFASFLATFRRPAVLDEQEFERLLWRQLEQVHDVDDSAWNTAVSADPTSEHFAFSAGGTAFFIVGLHPGASRVARRSPTPTLVFNLHEQFEALRGSGRFARMRDKIRQRDEQLQGSINPMVADHGQTSEARQYSGRQVPPGWRAPFSPQPKESS
jgi:uncharacterized protein